MIGEQPTKTKFDWAVSELANLYERQAPQASVLWSALILIEGRMCCEMTGDYEMAMQLADSAHENVRAYIKARLLSS